MSNDATHRRLPPRAVLFVVLALLVLAHGTHAASPRGDVADPALREEIHRIPVGQSDGDIVMTSYRPRGNGPFPWIVLSHGTATTPEANRGIGRYRNPPLVRQWLQRGYAVLVPIRRGYGASGGGRFADGYGSCTKPDFHRAGEAAALDLLAAVAWARAQSDLDQNRWLLVGQSAGGFASIYTAAKQPPGLVAVLAFAPGRGGDPEARPGEPCASDQMSALFAQVAPRISVPILWFYAENDKYIGPRAQKLWFESFSRAGGRGTLVVVPPFPHRLGHGVLPAPEGVPLWTAAVAAFIQSQGLSLPF